MEKGEKIEKLEFDFDSVFSDLRETDYDVFFDFVYNESGLDMESSIGDECLNNYFKNVFSILEL
jgi:hypothetical protein